MQLQELIDALETYDPSIVVREGFAEPHSYRGYYEQLAFEPAYSVTIGSMLDAARSAVGTTYHGYKGGSYTMEEWTSVHLANYGECGDELSERLLRYMLADRAL